MGTRVFAPVTCLQRILLSKITEILVLPGSVIKIDWVPNLTIWHRASAHVDAAGDYSKIQDPTPQRAQKRGNPKAKEKEPTGDAGRLPGERTNRFRS